MKVDVAALGGVDLRERRAGVGAAKQARSRGRQQHSSIRRQRQSIDLPERRVRRCRELRPGGAAVAALEDAGAANRIAVVVALAGAGVHHRGRRRIDRQRRDREHRHEIVQRRPARAAVCRLPDAAADAAGKHGGRRCGTDGQRSDPSADVAGAEPAPVGRRHGAGRRSHLAGCRKHPWLDRHGRHRFKPAHCASPLEQIDLPLRLHIRVGGDAAEAVGQLHHAETRGINPEGFAALLTVLVPHRARCGHQRSRRKAGDNDRQCDRDDVLGSSPDHGDLAC